MSDERLRDRIAEKLAEWAFQAAEAKGVKLTSFHRYVIEQEAPARADMVMAVVQPEVEQLRAELARRCDKDDCESFREWLSGEKAEADKRARQAEAERDRLAEQVQRVRTAHPRRDDSSGPVCGSCLDTYEEPMEWPCPTIAALDGETGGRS